MLSENLLFFCFCIAACFTIGGSKESSADDSEETVEIEIKVI